MRRLQSILAGFAFFGLVSFTQAGVPVVADGRAQAVVVLPAEPEAVVRYAAEELVYHVAKATGFKLPVVAEGQAPRETAGRIFLGPTAAAARAGIDAGKLSPDSFTLRTAGTALYVVGRDSPGLPLSPDTWAGTLFGVYEVLERVLGVRWLWPGELGEHVPKTAAVAVPDWNETIAPRLIIRRLRSTLGGRPAKASPEDNFSRPALAKARADEARWLRRQRMGHSRSMRWGHAFTSWWDKYGREHPEWFNLLEDGQRRPQGADGSRVSMCVSNPGLHKQIVENWLAACAARPDNKPNINGCENDVYGRCQCEACKAWDVPRTDEAQYPDRFSRGGIVSDRYARFWRTLQELAARHDPDAIVTGYAYVNYAAPPVREKLNDHVWIGLVPDAFFPRTAEEQRLCLGMWQGWARTGCKLFLRPNYTLDGYCMPYLYTHQFAEEFAHHARNGMIATDFDSLTAMWSAQGPQVYLFARWQNCLDRPVDEVLAEYYSGFGPAAEAVKAYFDYWEQYTLGHFEQFREAARQARGGWSTFPRYARQCFTSEAMAGGQKLLDRAKQAAAGDELAAARVEFLQKGLTHAEKSAAAGWARSQGDFLATQQALQDLRSYRRQIEKDNVANLAYCAYLEQRAFGPEVREVLYKGQPLDPLAASVQPAELKPIALRGQFGCVALLKAGESFQATITVRRVGRNQSPVGWSLMSPQQQPVAQGQIEPGKKEAIAVPVPADGIYNLILATGGNVAQLTLGNEHAVILGSRVTLLGSSGPMYFYVPASAKSFQVKLDSPGPGETAKITIFDPEGREAASGETGPQKEVTLKVSVPAGQRGKAWCVGPGKGPTGAWEDHGVTLGAEMPPYWGFAPDRLLVPAKASGSDAPGRR